jgi:hypothetical protein
MKKLIVLTAIIAYSCGQNETEARLKAIQDSISVANEAKAKADLVKHVADSIEHLNNRAQVIADSIANEATKAIEGY